MVTCGFTRSASCAPFVSASSTFSCPSTGVDGEAGSSPGFEVFYWDAITGVRVLVQSRDPFTVDLCPMPPARFPPRPDKYGARRRIEWYDAFDVVTLVSGRRPQFTDRELYGNDPVVIAAYADAVHGPC